MSRAYKRLAILLVIAAINSSLFSGCSSNVKNSESSNQPQTTENSSGTSSKIVSSPLTLKMFAAFPQKAQGLIKSSSEIAAYKELEKRTGIHIEFVQPPIGQEKDQFNLMVASNDLPDMIWYNWNTDVPGGPSKALSSGTINKLNDYIDKYAPNLQKVFAQYPQAKKDSMLDDGTFYMMPFIKPDKTVRTVKGFTIRKDWLEKLNLKVPVTIDDWHNVLTAFKNNDPNGNGKNDEIPFVSIKQDGYENFTQFATAWGVFNGFYSDNGKVKFGPIEPGFKDFLVTLRKWYSEGLIDSDIAINDQKQFDAKVTGNTAGAYYGLASGNLGKYMNTVKPKQPTFELVAVPYPVGPAGKSYNMMVDKGIPGNGVAITSANKHIAESIKWLDYQYSKEGGLLMNFGVEGESYTMVDGNPTFTDTILNNPKGLTPDQALALYATTGGASMVYDSRYYQQILTLPQQKEGIKTWAAADDSKELPSITPTADESSKMASIMNEVNTYKDEMIFKFIMGQESIDNFDKYVQNIKNMKIDDTLKIEQAALDRYNSRK